MLPFGEARLRAGGLLSRVHDFRMPLGGDGLLLRQDLAADGAVLPFGEARLRAGGLLGRVGNLGMPLGRDGLLLHQDLVADRAMLPFGHARLRAGGLLGRVGDLRMPLGRDGLLLCQDLAADRAMLAFGQTRLGAGGLHGLIHDLRMPLGRDGLLGYQDFAADGAVLALGQTRLRAGGLHGLIHDLRMPQGVYGLLGYQDFAAHGAMLALGQTRLRAGGLHGLIHDLRMPLGGDGLLLHQDLVADGAMLPLGEARLRAGGGQGGVDHLAVAFHPIRCCIDGVFRCRRQRGRPSVKGIVALRRRRLGRCFTAVGGRFAVGHLFALKQLSILVIEDDCGVSDGEGAIDIRNFIVIVVVRLADLCTARYKRVRANFLPLAVQHDTRQGVAVLQPLDRDLIIDLSRVVIDRVALALGFPSIDIGLVPGGDGQLELGDRTGPGEGLAVLRHRGRKLPIASVADLLRAAVGDVGCRAAALPLTLQMGRGAAAVPGPFPAAVALRVVQAPVVGGGDHRIVCILRPAAAACLVGGVARFRAGGLLGRNVHREVVALGFLASADAGAGAGAVPLILPIVETVGFTSIG